MSDSSKITSAHLSRLAIVYVRQSSSGQIERNQESTRRQYQLVGRARELGWPDARVSVIDEDLGISGAGLVERAGFDRLASQVALGRVGIVLGLEVSRLARSNADWYRLLDLCVPTDTLIADADGVYHPGLINDRLVLGLKGTMSEAELHVLRARLDGGIRNKAARGELRRGLPVGFVWGDGPGEVRFHPDAAVTGAIHSVFNRFTESGSARRVWMWFNTEELLFPQPIGSSATVRWVVPTYTKIHAVLTNPVYAGAYVYGKTRVEQYLDAEGQLRKRVKRLPRDEWAVVLPNHHQGFINWDTFEENMSRLAANTRPLPHQPGGAAREGAALLQGIGICGNCGRSLNVHYSGRTAAPGYHCPGHNLVNGRAEWCLRVGGCQIDRAVGAELLRCLDPAALEACLLAIDRLQQDGDAALAQWRRQIERLRYEVLRSERAYRAVDPDNRLVAAGLEAEWEQSLRALDAATAELALREARELATLTEDQRQSVLALHTDLPTVWTASTTTDRDRKELLRAVVENVVVHVDRQAGQAQLTLLWRGGTISGTTVPLPRSFTPPIRTDEDTVDLVRRLAALYNDGVIAGILNRQRRTTATGLRFTANRVGGLRRNWGIARFQGAAEPDADRLVSVQKAAAALGMAPSTVHRWINDGFIAAVQTTPGAPWQIELTQELRDRFVDTTPPGYVPMIDATRLLGVSRQTVLQRVRRGELKAVHVRSGRRKGLRIRIPDQLPGFPHAADQSTHG